MNGRKEHKRRYNRKLEFIADFEKWLTEEPPMILFWKWCRWKRRKPIWKEETE